MYSMKYSNLDIIRQYFFRERNLQLSFYSILLLLLVSVWENSSLFSFPSSNALLSLSETNQAPFVGWSVNTLFIAALQVSCFFLLYVLVYPRLELYMISLYLEYESL